MVGNLLAVRKSQEVAQQIRVRAAPRDAALAVEPLEIADHVHPEIPPRRQRRSAHPWRVVRLANLLHERVEPGFQKHALQAIVTHAPASAASPPMSPSGHPEQPPIVPSPSLIRPQANNATESEPHDFVNGLLKPMASMVTVAPAIE